MNVLMTNTSAHSSNILNQIESNNSILGVLEPNYAQDSEIGNKSETALNTYERATDPKVLSSSDVKLAESTNLLALTQEFGGLPEFIVRSLFKQIFKHVSLLHAQNLSLADYSFRLDANFNCIENTSTGLEDQSKEGAAFDAINLGILLFIVLKGEAPFENEDDPAFLAILEEDWKKFWDLVDKRTLKNQNRKFRFSLELRGFINRLLAADYEIMQESTENSWLSGFSISEKKAAEFLAEVRKKNQKI